MNFIRLNITAEGHTEERFVKNTLAPYLGDFNISTDVRKVLTSKDKYKFYRGGVLSYIKTKQDIQTWLKEDNNKEARFTTMVDLYALPNDFPKYTESLKIADPYEKVSFLEKAWKEDIKDHRFIPYIQLHEFEALVLAYPANLKDEYFEHKKEIQALEQLLKDFGNNPELINDKRETAPSKRIVKLIPEYDKVSVGAFLAGISGIEKLGEKCSHFREWIKILKELSV